VRQFVGDPRSFLEANRRDMDPTVMARYFAPMDPRRFWQAVDGLRATP